MKFNVVYNNQISGWENALKKLKEKGIIETGNYNKSAYDRTLWYAFTKMGDSIMQKCKMEESNLSNGLCKNVEPIPNIKPNINTNNINDNIFKFLEKNLGRTLGPIEIEKVSQWKDNELTRYAIKKSILNGKYNISYIDAIIYSYSKNGIKTVQQAEQKDAEFKNRKIPKKENELEWFDKDVESDTAEVESQEEMKELLKEFM